MCNELIVSVMSIQLAGFAGSNVFKAADAPRYRSGLLICGGCTLAGAVIVLCWKAVYAWDEKRKGGSWAMSNWWSGAQETKIGCLRDGERANPLDASRCHVHTLRQATSLPDKLQTCFLSAGNKPVASQSHHAYRSPGSVGAA